MFLLSVLNRIVQFDMECIEKGTCGVECSERIEIIETQYTLIVEEWIRDTKRKCISPTD